jgi:hypothetical protein
MNNKDNFNLLLDNNHFLPPVRSRAKNKQVFGSGIPESTDKVKTKEELERTITNCIIKNNSDIKSLNLKSIASFKTQTSKNKNSFLKREISSYNFKGLTNSSLVNSSESSNRRITIKMSNLLKKKSNYFPDTEDYSNFIDMESTNFDQVNSYYNLSHLTENCNIMGTHFTKNNSHTRLPFKHPAIKYDHALSKYKYKISDIDLSTDLKKLENEYSKKKKKVNLLNFDPFLNKENFHSKYKFNDAELKQKGDDESISDYYDSIYSQLEKNFRSGGSNVESIKMKTNYNANYGNLKSNLIQNQFQKQNSFKNYDNINEINYLESEKKANQTKILKIFENKKKINEIKDIHNSSSNFLNIPGKKNSPIKQSYPKEDESRNTQDLIDYSPNVNGSRIYEKKIVKVFERVKMIDYNFSKIHKNTKLLLNFNDNKKICN